MRVIAKRRLLDLADRHGDCRDQVIEWYDTVRRATWRHLADVRREYPHADVVGNKTVFNIKGNHYRLIVAIRYDAQIIYIKHLMTHAEYAKGTWKD